MILVLNAGSSTLKYKLFKSDAESPEVNHVLASGTIERIGENGGPHDHEHAIKFAIEQLRKNVGIDFRQLDAIGHRVVHAGDSLKPVEIVTKSNYEEISSLLQSTIPLAPLHNPPAIGCLETALALAPDVPNVLVFDTGFFQDLPKEASTYAVPRWFFEKHKIKRYGAHGTSHRYVSQQTRRILTERGLPAENLITLHLGNGASVAAIKNGQPIDTSMGLTPLEGLVMGTRCGDLDPAIVTFLQQHANLSAAEVNRILNKESGLKGLCGDSDMRLVEQRMQQSDHEAIFAFEVYCRRIQKYIGAYAALLEGLDAIVFTAGVGENSVQLRSHLCSKLKFLGVHVDSEANMGNAEIFSTQDSRVALMIVHTDEERAIFERAAAVVDKAT